MSMTVCPNALADKVSQSQASKQPRAFFIGSIP
jgi:hypothetical protein